ncbi:MAG: hypothetical protein RLZZ381_3991, partial [Cyanobacteriota bacterium]
RRDEGASPLGYPLGKIFNGGLKPN